MENINDENFDKLNDTDTLLNKYNNEIKEIITNDKIIFHNKKKNLLLLLDYYNNNILLDNKLNELIEIKLIENNKLIQNIDKINGTINTNERKVYYTEQQLNTVKNIKKYTMRYIFFVYILIFLSIFIFQKERFNYTTMIKFLILLLIPLLLIPVITRTIITFYNWIYDNSSIMNPIELVSKIALEIIDEFKLFFGIFYSPI